METMEPQDQIISPACQASYKPATRRKHGNNGTAGPDHFPCLPSQLQASHQEEAREQWNCRTRSFPLLAKPATSQPPGGSTGTV